MKHRATLAYRLVPGKILHFVANELIITSLLYETFFTLHIILYYSLHFTLHIRMASRKL